MASLPGLNLAAASAEPTHPTSTSTESRQQDLAANTEYRFEVSFSRTLTIRLRTGTAEFFGTELGPSTTYSFKGTKGAIYTWYGCSLEIGGEAESEYVAEATAMMSYANAHFALEDLRDKAVQTNEAGPRVLVVGPDNSGKTSLVRILTSYALKMERQPVVVNLDPREGMLSVPGSLTASAFSSILDVEEGWGSSPISGPSPIPVKMPLVYHYGLGNPEEGKVFRPVVTRLALAVTSRLEEDKASKHTGFIIDTPGAISHGRGGIYENIDHIVSEFSVNVIFILGSERLYSDLSRKYGHRTEDTVSVVRLDKSGGCVDRDEGYMKQLRQHQIHDYFFGTDVENTLAPYSLVADIGDLHIFKLVEASNSSLEPSFRPGDDDDDVYGSSKNIYEKVTPSSLMQNSLLAVTTASINDPQEIIRDASVQGYIYLNEVDEAKKKVRVLVPQPGQLPPNALVLGSFPEEVPNLLT